MALFDESGLQILKEGFASVPDKAQALTTAFLTHSYRSSAAKEYAQQGLCRRLSTLVRCIDQIFMHLPPEREDIPPSEVLTDTTIYLQAFVFNAFGVLDNLAFIWVHEKDIKNQTASHFRMDALV
jgi:hypothetical protein